MAFKGRKPIRNKIAINNQPVEQIQNFLYLDCKISYDGETYVEKKVNKFLRVTGAINSSLTKNKSTTRYQNQNVQRAGTTSITYGSEVWVLRKTPRQITTAEIKFMRTTAGYTCRDHKGNEDILRELHVAPILEKIKKY